MLSMMECLDKAAEMDACAASCEARETHDQYLNLGRRWHQLAVRALRQDDWAFEHRDGQISN